TRAARHLARNRAYATPAAAVPDGSTRPWWPADRRQSEHFQRPARWGRRPKCSVALRRGVRADFALRRTAVLRAAPWSRAGRSGQERSPETPAKTTRMPPTRRRWKASFRQTPGRGGVLAQTVLHQSSEGSVDERGL